MSKVTKKSKNEIHTKGVDYKAKFQDLMNYKGLTNDNLLAKAYGVSRSTMDSIRKRRKMSERTLKVFQSQSPEINPDWWVMNGVPMQTGKSIPTAEAIEMLPTSSEQTNARFARQIEMYLQQHPELSKRKLAATMKVSYQNLCSLTAGDESINMSRQMLQSAVSVMGINSNYTLAGIGNEFIRESDRMTNYDREVLPLQRRIEELELLVNQKDEIIRMLHETKKR